MAGTAVCFRRCSSSSAAADGPSACIGAHTGAEAEAVCRRAVADGVDALVAVGGDGTLHRALQAVGGHRGAASGVIPVGTGNDFAAGTGVPLDPLQAAASIGLGAARGRSGRRSTWPG